MSRTAITSARTAIGSARVGLPSARTSMSVYLMPIDLIDMGISHYWDFRTGKVGVNSSNVIELISNVGMSYRGTTAISSVYTSGEYSVDLERTNLDYFRSDSVVFQNGTSALTYFAWIKRESIGAVHHILADWETVGNQRGSRLYLTSDFFEVTLSSNGTLNASYTSTETLTDTSNWHFIIATYDTTNRCQMRLDDTPLTVSLTAGSHPATINSSPIAKLIGVNLPSTPANFFDGKIGICGVAKSSALTTSQASRLYNITRKFMGV